MEKCKKCANKGSMYCVVCIDGEWFKTDEQKREDDFLCDLMCGDPEKE